MTAAVSVNQQGTSLAGGFSLLGFSAGYDTVSRSASGNATSFTLLEVGQLRRPSRPGHRPRLLLHPDRNPLRFVDLDGGGLLGSTVSVTGIGGDSYTTGVSWPALPGYSDTVNGSDQYTRLISATQASSDGGYSATQTGSGTWNETAQRTPSRPRATATAPATPTT